MSKLIVSLPYPSFAGNGNTPYHYVLSDGQNRGKNGMATLSELPKADATMLVVPARALSWHQVDLPKVPKARLRAALDGLLEERLLDDTNAMALALSPEASAGKAVTNAWVAACDKAWLGAAIQAFDAAGCHLTQVVPEFWPQGEPIISITGVPEEAWITRADSNGVMTVPLRAGDTSGVLGAIVADFPASSSIWAEPAVSALAESSMAHISLPNKVELRQHATALLQSASSLWELAQFEQSLSGDSQGVKSVIRQWQTFWQSPVWRPVRWGLAAFLLANVLGLNVWAWQQQNSLNAKRTQMNTLLTQSFPSVKYVNDATQQMSRELVALRQATGASGADNFETILSAFSSSNESPSGVFIAPTAIEYAANGVNLKGIKLAGNELTAAQAKLKTLGYTLTQSGDTVKVQAAP
jgi:general secretion pathway protein L